ARRRSRARSRGRAPRGRRATARAGAPRARRARRSASPAASHPRSSERAPELALEARGELREVELERLRPGDLDLVAAEQAPHAARRLERVAARTAGEEPRAVRVAAGGRVDHAPRPYRRDRDLATALADRRAVLAARDDHRAAAPRDRVLALAEL